MSILQLNLSGCAEAANERVERIQQWESAAKKSRERSEAVHQKYALELKVAFEKRQNLQLEYNAKYSALVSTLAPLQNEIDKAQEEFDRVKAEVDRELTA